MKRVRQIAWIVVCVIAASWLYQVQLGAITFLSFSVFLFYLAYREMKPRAKKRRSRFDEPEEFLTEEEPPEKKAEIIT